MAYHINGWGNRTAGSTHFWMETVDREEMKRKIARKGVGPFIVYTKDPPNKQGMDHTEFDPNLTRIRISLNENGPIDLTQT